MTGYKITRDIFNSLPAKDGRYGNFVGWSQEKRDQNCKNIYINTKRLLALNHLLPAKENHNDKNEKLKGWIVDIQLKTKENPTPHYIIEADIYLRESFYDLYKEKLFPFISPEVNNAWDITSYVGNPTILKNAIYGIAFLGSTIPALNLNPKEKKLPIPMQEDNKYFNLNYDNNEIFENKFKVETMDNKELKKNIMTALAAALDTVFVDEDSTEEKDPTQKEEMKNKNPAPEKGKEQEDEEEMKCKDKDKNYEIEEESENFSAELEAKDKEIAELKDQIEKLKDQVISTEFNILATTGKANIEQKEKFARVAKSEGIEFAKDVFSMHNVAPPSGEKIPATPKELEDDNLKKAFKSMGFSDEAYKLATKGGK